MKIFDGSNSNDRLIAPKGTGDSIFNAKDGDDWAWGGNGKDVINGGNGKDLLKGAGGKDELFGEAGDDTLIGGDGHDALHGGIGNDILVGEGGQDYLNGGLGADTMYGGAGDDLYIVDNYDDKVIEKSIGPLGSSSSGGRDTVLSSVSYGINGDKEETNGYDIENLTLTGTASSYAVGNSIDNIIQGNNSDNMLFGMDGHDYLYGKNGNDVLSGGDGIDHLFGGDGNDQLVGNDGSDTLTGGLGADTFNFYSVSHSPVGVGSDKITDFSWLEGDKIDLSEIDANLLVNGDQAFALSQIFYDSSAGIFTADVTNGTDLQIEFIGGAPAGFDPAHDVIL